MGSSAHTIAGWATRARATATRCCSPPESSAGRCSVRCPRPTRSSMPWERSRASPAFTPVSSKGSSTFSTAVNTGIRLNVWNMKPMCCARYSVRRESAMAWRSSPSTSTVPSSMSSRPERQLSNVVLPLPDGPITERYWPRGIRRSTPRSASTSSAPVRYVLTTPRASRMSDPVTGTGPGTEASTVVATGAV